jgi:hypothetical protein
LHPLGGRQCLLERLPEQDHFEVRRGCQSCGGRGQLRS